MWIEVTESDHLGYRGGAFRLRDAELTLPVIQLDRLGTLRGVVVDGAGRPLSGASVHVYDPTHVFRHTRMPRTDAHGFFFVSGLPTGSYSVVVRHGMENLASVNGVEIEAGFEREELVIEAPSPAGIDPFDAQTLAVYGAEDRVRRLRRRHRFATLTAAQAWVDEIVASGWFRRRFADIRSIEVKTGAGRFAYANRYPERGVGGVHAYISLPPGARNRLVVLHEVAHVCHGGGGHGSAYAGILLALLERFVDREMMLALSDAFDETGAEVTPLE